MCHGQALHLSPLAIAPCRLCGRQAQLHLTVLRIKGERCEVKACVQCITDLNRARK